MDCEFALEKVDQCPVCDEGKQISLFLGQDDRYGCPGSFPVIECPTCGLIYLGVRVHRDAVPDLYEKYYAPMLKGVEKKQLLAGWKALLKNTSLMSLYQFMINSHDNLYRHLAPVPGKRVLDVGSGFTLEAHRILKKGGEWVGADVNSRVCLALNNAGLKSFCGTLEEFHETNPVAFDYILLSQVLEHVYHPRQFLTVARSLLSPQGKILLSCPNYDSFLRHRYHRQWLHWHVPYHVAQYNRLTLTRLAESVGLRIGLFQTFTPSNWFYTQEQFAKGAKYGSRLVRKNRWKQRLVNLRFAGQNRWDRGDAIVASLEVGP